MRRLVILTDMQISDMCIRRSITAVIFERKGIFLTFQKVWEMNTAIRLWSKPKIIMVQTLWGFEAVIKV
ncbi:hypothetical protein MOD68_20365 [Bacillus spizizenii]|nr:hypothetical protein [Bacillus spizizenii]